jgi:hypothetical protein
MPVGQLSGANSPAPIAAPNLLKPMKGNPFVIHTLIAMGCLTATLILMPAQAAWWQKALAAIFSVSFGFRIGTFLVFSHTPGINRFALFLLSITFIFLGVGVLLLPSYTGVILILAGLTWRFIVGFVMR